MSDTCHVVSMVDGHRSCSLNNAVETIAFDAGYSSVAKAFPSQRFWHILARDHVFIGLRPLTIRLRDVPVRRY